jgi:prophage regulatory protein
VVTDSEPPLGRTHLRILRLKEVITLAGLGRAAIYQMKREGKFPKPVKIGVRAVGWIAEDVDPASVPREKRSQLYLELGAHGTSRSNSQTTWAVTARNQLSPFLIPPLAPSSCPLERSMCVRVGYD